MCIFENTCGCGAAATALRPKFSGTDRTTVNTLKISVFFLKLKFFFFFLGGGGVILQVLHNPELEKQNFKKFYMRMFRVSKIYVWSKFRFSKVWELFFHTIIKINIEAQKH